MTHISARTIEGTLEPFSEQGTEGIVWCVYDPASNAGDGRKTLSGLNKLDNGDLLRIFSDQSRKTILWEGVVQLDMTTAGASDTPAKQVKGRAVHGVQATVEPETWFDYFAAEKPATLIKAAPTP